MNADDSIGEVRGEIPGARWLEAVLDRLRHLRPEARLLAGAARVRARVAPALPAPALRQRVETYRSQLGRPAYRVAPRLIAQGGEETPASPPARTAGDESRGLDADLRRRLERLLRFQLPEIHLHTGLAADRLARRHDADAVTIRRDIYFRQGEFDPGARKGMGLLAHEATHAAWDASTGRSGNGLIAPDVEERAALANERRALRADLFQPVPRGPARAEAAPPPGAPPRIVRTALTSRDLGEPDLPLPQAAALSDAQVRALKDDVYRALLDKVRSDFERGA